ncbi:MAG: glycosyltransferase family 2 protein [Bacteroidales bacterium]|nr:glycosyltransferase family 2 protein [Candidatus Sodaliphilus aphodohippi]
MKQVAVIILNWNGAELMRKYLPSVVANTNADIADVIVADNGSTDNSLDVLTREFPTVQVIKLDRNYGFAEGYNRAIAQVDHPYTVLLNSDVRTPEAWLDPLLDYMETNPDVGAVQPKLLHDNGEGGKETFDYAGAAGGYIDCHGYPYCRGRIFDCVEDDNGQYDNITPSIVWASGACLMVRTDLYRTAGGLDKDFFAHMEEIDLCWRIHLCGSDVRMVPTSRVYHLGGASLAYGNPRKTYLNFRNNLLLMHKNLPAGESRRILLVRRLLDTLAFAMALAKFHWGDAKAIIKAHNDFRKMRGNYTRHPDRNLLREMPECRCNIITDHYLRRRKVF